MGQSSCWSHVGRTGRGEWSGASSHRWLRDKKRCVKGQEARNGVLRDRKPQLFQGQVCGGRKTKGIPRLQMALWASPSSQDIASGPLPSPEGTLVLPIPWVAFCPSPWPQVFPPQPPPKAPPWRSDKYPLAIWASSCWLQLGLRGFSSWRVGCPHLDGPCCHLYPGQRSGRREDCFRGRLGEHSGWGCAGFEGLKGGSEPSPADG